ncbi:50S ribosomal protein L31 [Candidatus Amesbacteria bacterium RIFCSPHIGHO2_02_FULL_47_9]|uniref:Large ribosomal subunit protein bL31 n=1 Tax=Candidatus Amesbacteria bacterium RIFCSPHIGHO2_01_FULL_48_32b TaxID=1797253 RepID=A0A1F4YD75_9BACT|nr:MAG: 50S ribosomal protein L31 [Candidatus Amesbacteria bacterium RIFCSPHIGHO2_01_FULL_48_32b]OGD04271.1 MAG: 50S ribosomal protein L31 [Candidatus Amesbacteria bacterium RIFCSPHIGHO2_02_FULL_47_9]OGD08211.1 MAG: 50S ribosomal protein L31 [Candidatus Amesbacteria bacterium RIFCSPLOWO2_01_FULL_49_25]
MKSGIHPQYFQATVTCACGNSFVVGSTKQSISLDICSNCHPFFTGEMRFVDTLGRVEKFVRRQAMGQAQSGVVSKKQKKLLDKKREEEEEAKRPRSLKEMLDRVKAKA